MSHPIGHVLSPGSFCVFVKKRPVVTLAVIGGVGVEVGNAENLHVAKILLA
jgi:hypothetical protein